MALWSALSLLPDVDVLGFAFGVEYGDPWGHRGATHSLVFAVALGVAIGLASRRFNRPAVRTAVVASAVLASHALLDTMTDGGLGCALLWPFDLTRYFAPWRPIPVAPIGLDFLSAHGVMVVLAELVLFAPAMLFALRPPALGARAVGAFLAVWIACLSLLWYSDTTRDAIVGFLLREDTAHTPGFSEAAFRTITPGQSEADVQRVLGRPFREFWFYTPPDARPPDERPAPQPQGCLAVQFAAGVVATMHQVAACTARGVGIGRSPVDVRERLGAPSESCWQYTWSPGESRHRQRLVCFSNNRVTLVVRKWSQNYLYKRDLTVVPIAI